jgi:hypothetical protein
MNEETVNSTEEKLREKISRNKVESLKNIIAK